MFNNLCDWSKGIHKSIYEVVRSDHVVYKEICSRIKLSGSLLLLEKTKSFCENFFKAFLEATLIKILSQKLLSSPLVYIPASWDPGKGWTATGETSLGPNTAGLSGRTTPGVSLHHESSWSISNLKRFLIRSVQFCKLAARCVCRVIGSTNWIWPSKSIGILS